MRLVMVKSKIYSKTLLIYKTSSQEKKAIISDTIGGLLAQEQILADFWGADNIEGGPISFITTEELSTEEINKLIEMEEFQRDVEYEIGTKVWIVGGARADGLIDVNNLRAYEAFVARNTLRSESEVAISYVDRPDLAVFLPKSCVFKAKPETIKIKRFA